MTLDFVEPPLFTVTAPTRAFLDYLEREREVALAPGTHLRWPRAGSLGDPCSDLALDWDDFEPLDGEFAGRVVTVENAATPRDERTAQGVGPQWGPRPRLGPPKTIHPDTPIPNDLPWPAFAG